jgi:hypothetical protein
LTGTVIVAVSTIGKVVILDSIIAIVAIAHRLSVFLAPSADTAKNQHTTTIAIHLLFLLVTSYIDILPDISLDCKRENL